MEEKFNYCVAHYWGSKGKSIGAYTYHHQVKFGTMADAEGFLEYVKNQSPEEDWKIFKIEELGQQDDGNNE